MVFGGFGSSDHKEVIMGWWKKLKIWQKAGVIVGGIHFVVYMAILLFFPPVGGYLLFFMELPWMGLFMSVGLGGAATPTDMALIGVIGTFLYALSTMVISWLLSMMTRKITYDK